MARKRSEFRPDTVRQDILGKLLLTRKQRQTLLRWFLFSAVCLTALIVQDVIMSRATILGTTTDLVPCCILVVCILQGAEGGCIFSLTASLIYYWSGSAPGIYAVPLLTGLAVFTAIFRQAYLRRGFATIATCSAVSLLLYELAIFGIGFFLGHTIPARFLAFPTSALLTVVLVPVIYPILLSISNIGGETWKE